MAIFPNVRRALTSLFNQPTQENPINQAFYGLLGGAYTKYDVNGLTYLEKGFLYNPTVYSVVKQRSEKAKSIPLLVKRVASTQAKRRLDSMRISTKGQVLPSQAIKMAALEAQAFDEDLLAFPLEKPNELQTWPEIIALYETFMALHGNFYLYLYAPTEATNPEPLQVYVLPSHLIEIILKPNASMLGAESPIASYRMTIGLKYVDFQADRVIHVKTPNPNFGLSGEHLYGLSPLTAVMRNVQGGNEAIDNNIRTMLNSGSFGFLHGKQVPLTDRQADQVKERLVEMRSSTEVLSHIQGATAELAFTRVNLTTDELKPFEFLKFDEKQICNALGWDNKLLNNDEGAKYDNVEWAERRVLVNTIMPSLQLLSEALTRSFLPRYKSHQGAVLEFDYSEVPEMQIDVAEMVGWLKEALDRGVITRNEFRQAIKYPALDQEVLNVHTVTSDIISLEEAINNDLEALDPLNME